MKKGILILALVLSLSMVFAACGSGDESIKDVNAEIVAWIDEDTVTVKWLDTEIQEQFGEASNVDCSEAKMDVEQGGELVDLEADEIMEGLTVTIDLTGSDPDNLKAEHIQVQEV